MHTTSNQNIITLNQLSHTQNANDPNKRTDDDHNPRPTSTTTYASVLSQGASNQHSNHSLNKQQQQQQQQKNEDKDPFAAIRELGQRSNGLYNYFQ